MGRVRVVGDRAVEPDGYGQLLEDLKSRIKGAQVRAALAANRELIALYWDIGRAIVERQERDEWGASVIERLSQDLRAAFPDATGFSPRNLWRMRALYVTYARSEPAVTSQSVILSQPATEIGEQGNSVGQSVILSQPVTEIGEQDNPVGQSVTLSQPVTEIGEHGNPAGQSVILSQSVTEIGEQGTSVGQSVILSQPVTEIGEQGNPVGQSVILSQPVTEMAAETVRVAAADDERRELPPLIAELPWGHNIVLLESLSTNAERLWYARMSVRHGWSRNVLVHQIETGLYSRTGTAVTNFDRTLPAADSDLVRELLKDPYHFGFLQLGAAVQERDLERALLSNVRDFLMELGMGFALMGSQYHLELGGQDYFLDLLFYHTRLRRHVVVELKIGAFQPEDAGKMSFYLAAVDELVRQPGDEPSIGLILCKERNRVVAEYALRSSTMPISISEYRTRTPLPEPLQASLPSVREIEQRLLGNAGLEN